MLYSMRNQIIKPDIPVALKDVAVQLKIKFNGIKENIYIKHPLIGPYDFITYGIAIDMSKQDTSSVTINFSRPPNLPSDIVLEELTK